MAVQILGLREYFNRKKNKIAKKETFFEKGWRAPDVAHLIENYESYVEQIPKEERVNLYYTVGECLEAPGRQVERQTVIPFDIDNIDVSQAEQIARVACQALGVDYDKTGVVFSGNGVQILIDQPHKEFSAEEHFESHRPFYKGCTARITLALTDNALTGEVDNSVWSPARLMRLPGTLNRKPNRPEREAVCLQRKILKQDFDLERASGIIRIAPKDQIAESVVKRLPKPDTKAVLEECLFLRHCKENQATIKEPQWYASLSILRRLDDGAKLVHEYSREHPGYSYGETELKAEQAIANSGPRTCASIDLLWGGCKNCKYFEHDKVKSPIMIQGEDYIITEKSGFHQIVTDQNGNHRPGKPQVEDLRRFFHRERKYVTLDESRIVYTWSGKMWVEMKDAELENFAHEHFNPKVNSSTRSEFVKAVQCTNLRPTDWFTGSTDRRINFANGILNIDTGELEPHSPEHGFRYVLPYDYDAKSECPNFDKFMEDITCRREALVDVLLEFMGYAFSGDECWEHKALLLLGTGRNGKSTFMQVLEMLAGEGTYSSVTLSDLKHETARQQLDGRLFNLAEETSPTALIDSSVFKNLVAGGKVLVKKLYKQPYTIKNRCKLIFSCNELPMSRDKTEALYARMLIIPFDNKFEGNRKDPRILQKLAGELPGIFNRVLDGYRRITAQKSFTDSEYVRTQVEIYESANDSVLNFVQDELNILDFAHNGPRTATKDIYQAYRFYSETVHGEKPMASPQFFALLKRRIQDYDKRFVREMAGGVRERKLIGVLLAKGVGV